MIVAVALFCVALSLVGSSDGASLVHQSALLSQSASHDQSIRIARQAPPPPPEGAPAPPSLNRVARQAPPPPPEGAPTPPSLARVVRQAPPPLPDGMPAPPFLTRVARQLPPPPDFPPIPGQVNELQEAAAAMLPYIRNRREAKGTVRLPTKTG